MFNINKGLPVGGTTSSWHYVPVTFRLFSLAAVIIIGVASILASGDTSELEEITSVAFDTPIYVRTGSRVDLDARASTILVQYGYLNFQWSLRHIPTGSSAELTTRGIHISSFIADIDGEYDISLMTFSGDAKISGNPTWTKTITAFTGNAPPVAVTGASQHVLDGQTVQLDGSQSYDADDDLLNYNWTLGGGALSSISIVNPSFVANVDTGSVETTYGFRLTVNDNQADSLTTGVVIKSYPPENSRPVAMAGPDQYVTTDSLVQLDGSTSYSLINTPLDYEWRIENRPSLSRTVLDSSTSITPTFTADVSGVYLIGLKVYDAITDKTSYHHSDGISNSKVVIFAGNGNIPPVANGGPDFVVNQGEEVTLNGSNSSDAENAPLSYTWSIFKAPAGSSNALTSTNEAATQFIPDLNGIYLISLIVNDGQDDSAPDIVRIIANTVNIGVNQPPMANAGPDQPGVLTDELVTLDGSASSDPENQPLTYLWSFFQQPVDGTATLSDNTAVSPSFTPNVVGEYIIRLSVNDGLLDSIADTVSVTVIGTEVVCNNPLTLQTDLPYLPGLGEAPTIFQIDASVIDTIRLVSFDDPSAYQNVSALQASIPDLNQISEVDFISLNANWTIFGRSHNNPVSDSESPWFILERQSDNIFFKVDVGFTGTAGAEVQIDSLTACRCGANAGDCP